MKTNYVKYLFSFVLALWASALSAQTHWTVNDNFSSYMTIYFDLTLGDEAVASEKRSNYEVVAMIDDDCRGRGEYITSGGHTYGLMMVFGDAVDNGKELTFKVWNKGDKKEDLIYGVHIN